MKGESTMTDTKKIEISKGRATNLYLALLNYPLADSTREAIRKNFRPSGTSIFQFTREQAIEIYIGMKAADDDKANWKKYFATGQGSGYFNQIKGEWRKTWKIADSDLAPTDPTEAAPALAAPTEAAPDSLAALQAQLAALQAQLAQATEAAPTEATDPAPTEAAPTEAAPAKKSRRKLSLKL